MQIKDNAPTDAGRPIILVPQDDPIMEQELLDLLLDAGLEGGMFTYVSKLLMSEYVTTVALLRRTWAQLREQIRIAPRVLLDEHLFWENPFVVAPMSTRLMRQGSLVMGRHRSLTQDKNPNSPVGRHRSPTQSDKNAHSSRMEDALLNAEMIPIDANNKELFSHFRTKTDSLQTKDSVFRMVKVYEWRDNGYAVHKLRFKDLIEWFASNATHDGGEVMTALNELSCITARDLRKLDPHFIHKSANSTLSTFMPTKATPFVVIRNAAVVCSVAELNLSAIIMRSRVFFLHSYISSRDADNFMIRMLRRLEASRELGRLFSAEGSFSEEQGNNTTVFGFGALDAILGEIVFQLHARIEKTARRSNAVLARVSKSRDLMDDNKTEQLRSDVRRCALDVRRDKACAVAVEEVSRTLLEDHLGSITAVLAGLSAADAPEAETILESHLHELGNLCAELDLAELHIEHSDEALLHREHNMRNRLLRFEVYSSATTTGLAAGACIAGIFGMNISPNLSFWLDDTGFFWVVSIITLITFGTLLAFVGTLFRGAIWRHFRSCLPRRIQRKRKPSLELRSVKDVPESQEAAEAAALALQAIWRRRLRQRIDAD